MEASVRSRYPLLAATAAAAALSASSSSVVDAFVMPRPLSLKPSLTSLAAVGMGPQSDKGGVGTAEPKAGAAEPEDDPKYDDPFDPRRIVRGEDGLPMPHVTDHEPYREVRMSTSDRDADAWFASLLESPGDSFLGVISERHMDRLRSKPELVDEPVILDQEDEEWTPYVSRRLPTSPLYPAYGLETYGLPVLRRGAEAWRQFDVNGLCATDYSSRPVGIGRDYEPEGGGEGRERVIRALRGKGAWLDAEQCAARLVYIDGRFCPGLSIETDTAKNLDSSHFEAGLPEETLEYLSRLPDGHTDELAAEVPDDDNGPLTSLSRLSGPDHNVGKATSQFAINNQQGTAAFAALNSIKAGCVAYLAGKGVEKKPVLIINAQTPSGGCPDDAQGVAVHPRTLAVAEDGSSLSFVQMYADLDEDSPIDKAPCPTFVNGYTQIFVGANANVTHSFLDETGGTVTPGVELTDSQAADLSLPSARQAEARRKSLADSHFQCVEVNVVGDNGRYSSSLMELGGTGRSRLAISALLLRPGAFASINGYALSGGLQRTDMRTNIHHAAQGTTSRQEQRNMVGGRSTASFRGRIRVEQSAQQTDSEQLSRTMLLSDHARVWSTPSLEIIADDVVCTHGATVSDLSEEELFYLRSRGLGITTSRNMLMYAFVEEICGTVEKTVAGGFDDKNGLRSRIIHRLENLVPKGEKTLVGGEFQSS